MKNHPASFLLAETSRGIKSMGHADFMDNDFEVSGG
jgi:hypothetical protein